MPRAIDGMKECTGCREVKPVSQYQKQTASGDGLRSRCRDCRCTDTRTPLIVDGKKRCTVCGETKPVESDFYFSYTRERYASKCKECTCVRHAQKLRESEGWQAREKEKKEIQKLLAEGQKACSKCGVIKPVAKFSKSSRNSNGFAAWCRMCRKEHYKNNHDPIRAQQRQYREDNKEQISAQMKASYYENKIPAIYKIVCKINGRRYIGQSSGYHRRFAGHRGLLSRGTHPTPDLQKDYNKYGKEAFEYSTIRTWESTNVPAHVLREEEDNEMLKQIRAGKSLYNCTVPHDNGDKFVEWELNEEEEARLMERCFKTNKTVQQIVTEAFYAYMEKDKGDKQ